MKKRTKKLTFLMAVIITISAFTTVSIVSSEGGIQPTTNVNFDCINPELGRTGLLPPEDMGERRPYPYERSDGGLVYILIQEDMYASITDSVYSLVDNIENRRNVPYTVEIMNGTWSDHPQVRRALQDGLDDDLVGAILIDDIPVSWYYLDGFGEETFPIDLYYMDLDGEWGGGDGTQHNPYTTHTDGTGDVEPEIWVGRLYTDSLGSLGSSEVLLEGYIDRVDDYSRGMLTREDEALVFVDNDWYDWADQWDGNVGLLYENRTFVKEYRDTNAENYLNNLTIDYEWVSLFAHSNPRLHVFYPEEGGSNTYAYNTDISGTRPRALFYNLFCCSGTEYTYSSQGGYIAGHYLFAPSVSGLVAVGSTKTGSMLHFQDFYHPLSQGAGIGEAFRHWHVLNGQSSRDWFYGMNILGDPTLETGGYDLDEDILTFDIPLNAGGESDGWNFVSFNLMPLDTPLEAILDNSTYGIAGNYDKVMWYGGTTYDINYETIFSDDVEDGDLGYITGTSHLDASTWDIRQHGSSSGDNSWDFGDGLFNKRSDVGMLSWLISPEIDLSGANSPELTFQHWRSWGDTALYDAGNVKISTDGTDGPWTLITPEEGYDGIVPTDWDNPMGGEWAWGGSSGWTTATFDLSEYAGGTVHIRWDAGTEAWDDYNGPGWRVDEIEVTGIVYDISGQASWRTYIPGRAEHFNNLDTWDHSMGIWIHMTTSDILTVVGTRPGDTSLILSPGWNMVGIPSETAGNHGLPEEVTKIGYFDPTTDYNLAYTHNPGAFVFEPGKGYWLYNSADYMVYWYIDY